MVLNLIFLWILVYSLFSGALYSSSEEVYRWTDEKGTTHFTDDASKIPERYRREAGRLDVTREKVHKDLEIRESAESGKRIDRVRNYLETIDQKIEAKKIIDKRISELEEEMRLSEERLKWIDGYEKDNYLFYIPFKDKKTGKLVPVVSPYYEEKVRLKRRIESIRSELKSLRQKLSGINRGL